MRFGIIVLLYQAEKKPSKFLFRDEWFFFRRWDGVSRGEFSVGFLCLHVASSGSFLAGAACSAVSLQVLGIH